MTTTTTTTTATLAMATPHDVLRLVAAQAEADGNAAVLGKIERGRASPEDRARASGMAERALGAERLRRAGETGELPPRSVLGSYPRREQVERWPFAGDLDWSATVAAFSGTSHVPEQRAAGTFWDYATHMQKMKGLLGDDFEAYRAGYLPRFRSWLGSRANVVSTMIAGGSGFNVRRAEKRSATADNRWSEVDDFHRAFLKRLAREQVAERRKTGGAVAGLRAEIESLERLQEAMKAVNAEIRKLKVMPTTPADINTVAALIEARTGMAAADVAKALVPDFARRVGFPSHALSNNNANIKRKQERLADEEAKAARAADTGEDFTREVPVTGGVVSVRYNRELDRLQLDFPKGLIPEGDLSGWNRAYTLGVWQRQLTPNAVGSANYILSKAGATERLPTLAESLAARAPAAPAAAGAELTAEDEAAADADAAALVVEAGLVEPEAGEEAEAGEGTPAPVDAEVVTATPLHPIASEESPEVLARRLQQLLERGGWNIDRMELDFTGERPQVDAMLTSHDGRRVYAKTVGSGTGFLERYGREEFLGHGVAVKPGARMARSPQVKEVFLGRQRYEGARSMMKGLVTYIVENAPHPLLLSDVKKAMGLVMSVPLRITAEPEAGEEPDGAPAPGGARRNSSAERPFVPALRVRTGLALGPDRAFDMDFDRPGDDGNTRARMADGYGAIWRVPTVSVRRWTEDLNAHLFDVPRGLDRRVDEVLDGRARFAGKGNDGLVWITPSGWAVKADTVVLYQPQNDGQRTPEQAARHLEHEADVHRALADLPMVPRCDVVRAPGGRVLLIKPALDTAPVLDRSDLLAVEATVKAIHERGWIIGDHVQVGRAPDGRLYIFDLGSARRGDTAYEREGDKDYLQRLWRDAGFQRPDDPDHSAKQAELYTRMVLGRLNKGERPSESTLKGWREHTTAHGANLSGSDFDAYMRFIDRIEDIEDRLRALPAG
jgi:hypothetical protein